MKGVQIIKMLNDNPQILPIVSSVGKILEAERDKTREVIVRALMDAGSKGLDLEDTADFIQSRMFSAKLDSISSVLGKLE